MDAKTLPSIQLPSKREVPLIDGPGDTCDAEAQTEAVLIADETLEAHSRYNAHKRREEFRAGMHRIMYCMIHLYVFAYAVLLLCWLFHEVTPSAWRFLDPQQLAIVQTLVFSNAVTAALSKYSRDNW